MNATSLQVLRAAQAAGEQPDERLAKVRDLLIGDHAREMEARIASLALKLEQVETTLTRQLDALAARLDALAGSVEADRRAAFLELSNNVEDLAARIRTLSRT